jgi:uncharacterized membrane protein
MNSLFATIFPNRGAAEDAQRVLEKLGDEGVLKVVASVVVARGQDGEITQHNGRTPGPLGAGLGGVLGGILGLVVGPIGAIAGAAAGAISGGWFDLLRVEERDIFMREVAGKIRAGDAALLGEAINPSDEAKRTVETRLRELGGSLVSKDC